MCAMPVDERRYASHRRGAPRGADACGYTSDNRRRWGWARAQWGMGGNDSASACRVVDAHDRSGGAEYGRPPPKRPRGSGDLPQPVHFVSATGSAVSSRREPPENSRKPGSCDPARQQVPPPQPGSLASNTVVANMMKRMNYKEGAGLGKNCQGIIAPIEVAFRPKNAGLGTVEGSTEGPDEPQPPPSAGNWPKWDDATGGAKKRVRGFTGPERNGKRDHELDERILAARPPEESAAEAVARVQKAVARAARWSTGQGDLCCGEETAAIAKAMKWVQEETASGTLTLDELVREFTALKEKHPRAYTAFRLADAARAVVAPLLRPVFRHWELLEDPSRGLRAVSTLRGVLLDDGSSSAASPYVMLVDNVIMAEAVRAAEAWDARDHEPMVRFLETWGDALPLPAIQRLLERVVMPKLAAAVESWEPRWDPVPCHAWVRPWIPLLGRRWLEQQLFAAVRRKLGEALLGWHAARALADYDMVSPWKEAFGPAAWEGFVEGSVVPYLRQGLRALQVAPPREEDGAFGAVMRWAPVVPAREMARLLDEELFGRWRITLCRWLRAERPTVREAVTWHEGWKRLLTPELLADERVRVPLEAGLDMISCSAQGLEINWSDQGGGQHAGEAHSCRYRSRRRAVAGCGNSKRF